ncbi:MAG: 5-(carboxyamino)imidazole ribonucleotide mutase [Dehalococcoidia bacterium]|nr:5-(carboxyamino)imidazole ribonucleotide mutase [Dehalococcoidia bacterium]
MPPLVAIVMGSTSDEAIVQETQKVLDDLGVDYETRVLSAHRTPDKTRDYALSARGRGIRVMIGVAGAAAHLPGVLASWTTLPVIGVPAPGSDLGGIDALYSIVQMPPGVPVAAVAIGGMGARNAAYLAASIIGTADERVQAAYEEFRKKQSEA